MKLEPYIEKDEQVLARTQKAPINFLMAVCFNRTPINLTVIGLLAFGFWSEGLEGFRSVHLQSYQLILIILFTVIGITANVYWWREYFFNHLVVSDRRIYFSDMGVVQPIEFELLTSYKIRSRLTGTQISIRLDNGRKIVIDDVLKDSALTIIAILKRAHAKHCTD